MIDPPAVPLAPGWHDDPESPTRLRYYDGAAWTDRTSDKAPAAPVLPVAPTWSSMSDAYAKAGPHKNALNQLSGRLRAERPEVVIPASITTRYGDAIWVVIAVTGTRVIVSSSGAMGLASGVKETPRKFPHPAETHDMPGNHASIEIMGAIEPGGTNDLVASKGDAGALLAALRSSVPPQPSPESASMAPPSGAGTGFFADHLALVIVAVVGAVFLLGMWIWSSSP